MMFINTTFSSPTLVYKYTKHFLFMKITMGYNILLTHYLHHNGASDIVLTI